MKTRIILPCVMLLTPLAGLAQGKVEKTDAAKPAALTARQRWMKDYIPFDLSHALTFSPDGSVLAAGSEDGTVRIFDAKDGTLRKKWAAHKATIRLLTFHPKTSRLLSSEFSGQVNDIKLWDFEAAKEEWSLLPYSYSARNFSYSRDGAKFATIGLDKGAGVSVKIWDAESRTLKQTIKQRNAITDVALSPDCKIVAFCIHASRKGRVLVGDLVLWDLEKDKELRTINDAFDSSTAMQCWFAPDGKHIITADATIETRVWETETGKLVRRLKGCCRAYAPEANIVAVSRTKNEEEILQGLVLLDPLTGKELVSLNDLFLWAALSPDGRLLAGVDGDSLRVWELAPKTAKEPAGKK